MAKRWPLGLGLALGLGALVAGLISGADATEGWRLAARWTARVGFPILILTYAASSLVRLFPAGPTKALMRDRRWWGLGFFASHSVHLVALLTYLQLSGEGRPLPVLIGGGGAYVMLFAMAATSSDAAMRALGRNWKRLHTLGIHWLWFVFFVSYLGRAAKGEPVGIVGTGMCLLALGLRIAAALRARMRRAAT